MRADRLWLVRSGGNALHAGNRTLRGVVSHPEGGGDAEAILCLVVTIGVALVGLFGVPEAMEGIVQLAFFSLVVVFVILVIDYLVRDR